MRVNKNNVNYQIGVHNGGRVSLDTDDGQIKCRSQFRVSDVGLLETETGGPNEPFELWRFSGEILRNETDLQATS